MKSLAEIVKESGPVEEERKHASKALVEGHVVCPGCSRHVLYAVIRVEDFRAGPPYKTLRCLRCAELV